MSDETARATLSRVIDLTEMADNAVIGWNASGVRRRDQS